MTNRIKLVLLSPWSGDTMDYRKLRHYNIIKSLEESEGYLTELVVENHSFGYIKRELTDLKSTIIYTPSLAVNSLNNKKLKRLANMILYVFFTFFYCLVKKRNSVFWGSSPHPGASLVGGLMKKIRGSKFIYEIRDPWPELPEQTGALMKNSIPSKIFKKIDMFARYHADLIILINNMPIEKKYSAKSKVIVNGIPKSSLKQLTPKAERTFKDNNLLKLVFAGGCARAFKMEVIFKAISIVKTNNTNIELNLYVSKSEESRFKSLLEELNINTNVKFHPQTNYHSLIKKISENDFYILHLTDDPIFRHGINSNKLLDSFIAGVPCIFAANVPGNHVEKSKGGLLSSSDNPNMLAVTLQKAFSLSPDDYLKLKDNCQTYLNNNLILDNSLSHVINVCETL